MTRAEFTKKLDKQQRRVLYHKGKGKGKAVPLRAWTGPEGSLEVKVPRFRDNGTGWR